MRFITLLLFAIPLFCQTETKEFSCTVAVLEWNDAILSTRSGDVEAAHTARIITFGCVEVRENDVVVIMSITSGTPDVFLTIPKQWVTKITPLEVKKEEKKEEVKK